MNQRIQNFLLVVAVACAVTTTGLAVRKSLQPPQGAQRPPVAVDGVDSIIAGSAHISGPRDADVSIVEFFDLQCPACRMLSFALDTAVKAVNLRVRIARRHFPLPSIHPKALDLALAGLCLTTTAEFDEYYHRAFELQGLLGSEGAAGIMLILPATADSAAVKVCMSRPATWDRLQRDVSLGDALRISATPSFIVGGRLYTGARDATELARLIREAAH